MKECIMEKNRRSEIFASHCLQRDHGAQQPDVLKLEKFLSLSDLENLLELNGEKRVASGRSD